MRIHRLSTTTLLTTTFASKSSHHHTHTLPPLIRLLTTTTTTMASSSPSPSRSALLTPTYDNALHLLSLLQSNKTIVNLFAAAPRPADINASALPEMRAWLVRAGYRPADLARLRCLHVAGTKGKGSVSALAASVLRRHPQAAGRVGLYTSPHLVSPRERICLGGGNSDDDVAPISRDAFTRYFFELWDALSDAARRDDADNAAASGDPLGADGPSTKPFYFRFLTLLAFHAFLREGVTSAVVECGIGGEYDSTNVLPPEAVTACVVAQLGIDHVGMLGDTVDKIAWHKAGIFKPGVPAYTYQAGRPPACADDADDSAMAVLRGRAAERGTSLHVLGDADLAAWAGVASPRMEGAFQKGNMALAMVAARQHLLSLGHEFVSPSFQNDGAPLPHGLDSAPAAFVAGLQSARLRGRCETVVVPGDEGRIQWYLDGAHTEDSLVQVARWFAGKVAASNEGDTIRVLVFNQQDRDAAALLRALLDALQAAAPAPDREVFHHVFCPTNDMHPAAPDEKPDLSVQRRNCDVVREFCPSTAASPADSVSLALDMARNVVLASREGRDNTKVHVLVTGSFNLVGPALRLLESDIEL